MINQVMGCFFIFLHLFFHHFYVDFFHDSWLLPTGVDTLMDSLSTNIALTMLGGLQQALEWQNSFCKILTRSYFGRRGTDGTRGPFVYPPAVERGGPAGQASSLTYSLAVPCSPPAAWLAEDGPMVQGALGCLTVSRALQEKRKTTGKTALWPGAPKHKGFAPKTCAAWSRCTGAEFSLTCCEPPGSNLWHVAEICTLYFCAHFLFA